MHLKSISKKLTYKTILLSLTFSFVCFFAFAQGNLKVKITSVAGKPIYGATASLLNTPYKIISDSNGYLNLNNIPQGKYELSIQSLGFATSIHSITIVKQQNETLTYKLSDELVQLEDVVITAQKKEELLQKVPISITSFNSTQIEKFKFWNNKDISGFVPNLYSADPGDNRDVVSIRGITSTSYDPAVATYIDGVNQFNLDTYILSLIHI